MLLTELFDNTESIDFDNDSDGIDYEAAIDDLLQRAEELGGFTVNANTFDDAEMTDGYQVAIEDVETRASLDNIELMITALKDINDYINNQSSNDLYVGGWIYNDELVMDVSQYVEDREHAMALGLLRNQEAIFDNAANEDIMLIDDEKSDDEMEDFEEVEDDFSDSAELDFDDVDDFETTFAR